MATTVSAVRNIGDDNRTVGFDCVIAVAGEGARKRVSSGLPLSGCTPSIAAVTEQAEVGAATSVEKRTPVNMPVAPTLTVCATRATEPGTEPWTGNASVVGLLEALFGC